MFVRSKWENFRKHHVRGPMKNHRERDTLQAKPMRTFTFFATSSHMPLLSYWLESFLSPEIGGAQQQEQDYFSREDEYSTTDFEIPSPSFLSVIEETQDEIDFSYASSSVGRKRKGNELPRPTKRSREDALSVRPAPTIDNSSKDILRSVHACDVSSTAEDEDYNLQSVIPCIGVPAIGEQNFGDEELKIINALLDEPVATCVVQRMSVGGARSVMLNMIEDNLFRISNDAHTTTFSGSARFSFRDLRADVTRMTAAFESQEIASFIMRPTHHSAHFIHPDEFIPVQAGRVKVYACSGGRTKSRHDDVLAFRFYNQGGFLLPDLTVRVVLRRGAHSAKPKAIPQCPVHGIHSYLASDFGMQWSFNRGCPRCDLQ